MAGIEKRFCEDCKKREEIYYHFTQAVALFEMFFLKDPSVNMLKSAMKCCRKLQLKWNDCKRRGTKNVEEALSLATEYEKVVNDVFKRGKGEPEKYYDLMRRLAYPVYCKLGGNGCIMD